MTYEMVLSCSATGGTVADQITDIALHGIDETGKVGLRLVDDFGQGFDLDAMRGTGGNDLGTALSS